MPIDPEIQAMLASLADAKLPPISTLTPEEARAFEKRITSAPRPKRDIWQVSDLVIQGDGSVELAARLYRPAERSRACVVYFHAGGWVLGSLDGADGQLRWLAEKTGCAILSVAYRLAPENPFPAAVEDACVALSWAQANVEALAGGQVPLVAAGESAGANIGTVAAIAARDRGDTSLAAQILLYPVTDSSFEYASYQECDDGLLMPTDTMAWFWSHYVPDVEQRLDPRAAPIRTTDLFGLPPTLIQTAEFDPLRDEGEAFGRRLAESGVDVTVQRRPGLIHGYAGMHEMSAAARAAMEDVAAFLDRISLDAEGGEMHEARRGHNRCAKKDRLEAKALRNHGALEAYGFVLESPFQENGEGAFAP